MTTQFSQKAGDATNGKRLPVSSIFRLLKGVLPFAIGFAIALVVLDSAKRFACWSSPHVGQEIGEFIPGGINQDASATIVSVANVVWVKAALAHVVPRFKGGSLSHSVNPISALRATFRSSSSEHGIAADCFIPTIAKANAVVFAFSVLDHQKLAEPLSNQGWFISWHNSVSSLLCFRGGPWCRYQGPLLHCETCSEILQG